MFTLKSKNKHIGCYEALEFHLDGSEKKYKRKNKQTCSCNLKVPEKCEKKETHTKANLGRG
jgi:hypothetical protein